MLVVVEVVLPAVLVVMAGHLSHPVDRLAQGIDEAGALGLELLGDGLNVDVQVVAEEVADLGVFVVADERRRGLGGRGKDVDVGSWESLSATAIGAWGQRVDLPEWPCVLHPIWLRRLTMSAKV